MSGSTAQAHRQQITPAQMNAMRRAQIWRQAKPIFQKVTSKTFTNVAAGNNVVQVNPLQVGFLRRFLVEVTGTIQNTDATHALVLTPNGIDNIISNITFNDFTGNPRHNASGKAFGFVEAAKYRRVPGAAYTTDSVSGYGNNVASNVAPAIAAASSGTFRRVFEIPIMVDLKDQMAGGMWLGTNNQSTTLNITLNPTPIGLPNADPLNLVYTLAAGGATISGTPITSSTVTVYQDYWNNVPYDPKTGNPLLPPQDVSTAYMITEQNSGMTLAANQISSWNYPTFSKLLGTYLEYDNGGVLNPGTDISLMSLVISNYSIIRQYDPYVLDRVTRDQIGASFPDGCYALVSRSHNLNLDQYPSLQLQFTPSNAAAGAIVMVTTELLRPVQYMAAASGMGGV